MPEYYILNKPQGVITARRDPRHPTVMDLFPEEKREVLFPVGRLDKDTEGLLIITDDGRLNASLLSPQHHVKKTYLFYALGTLSEEVREEIEEGIKLYPTREVHSLPAEVTILGTLPISAIKEKLSPNDTKRSNRRPDTPVIYGTVTVTEGKKHQVKRMLMYGGCRIVYLKRLSMGNLTLDEALLPGEYRSLTEGELSLLREK
ncbi:MAG: pseudouridine synthase [Clostridia bacterium]|nr:pseudouridine synthase [Clostridia bacterium]